MKGTPRWDAEVGRVVKGKERKKLLRKNDEIPKT